MLTVAPWLSLLLPWHVHVQQQLLPLPASLMPERDAMLSSPTSTSLHSAGTSASLHSACRMVGGGMLAIDSKSALRTAGVDVTEQAQSTTARSWAPALERSIFKFEVVRGKQM